jgi:hypothetical protein
MSTFERGDFQWRETYFVMFEEARRPKLRDIERRLHKLNPRFQLVDPVADDGDRLESLTILAPDDYAALDIGFVAGEEVLEQGAQLYQELKAGPLDDQEQAKLARVPKLDAKFDLLHFERMSQDFSGDEEPDEMLDPSALLIVLDALVEMTHGVGVDPQSGTLV